MWGHVARPTLGLAYSRMELTSQGGAGLGRQAVRDCLPGFQGTGVDFWTRTFCPAHLFFFKFLEYYYLGLFRATLAAYGSSQARGQIVAVVACLHHSHSNARSELCLRPTLQFTATLDL